MMKAAKKAQSETNKKLKILAVTVLTSLSNKDLKQMGSSTSVESQVQKLAQTAKLAKIHGIVCSAHEIKKVRRVSRNFEIVVPGIRISNKDLIVLLGFLVLGWVGRALVYSTHIPVYKPVVFNHTL